MIIGWLIAVPVGILTFLALRNLVGAERLRNHYGSLSRVWIWVIVASSVLGVVVGTVIGTPELIVLGAIGIATSAAILTIAQGERS
jgi:hypothetical protein